MFEEEFVVLNCSEGSEALQQEISKIRKGNNDIDVQLKRDIEMLSQAIVHFGTSESDKVKAQTLLKSILLLYFGDVSYRDKEDNKFHSWSELNAYTQLDFFPIAAVLLHGSRALIEFPSAISGALIDWLIIDKACWRYTATHGIKDLDEGETLANDTIKYLQEEKVDIVSAAYYAVTNMAKHLAQHYGINLALGGAGNDNFFSGETIRNNGEHGHLYVHYNSSGGEHGGLLLGIEQSAPGADDHYGGAHDVLASEKKYSASGGDFFCKPPNNIGVNDIYIGLKELPIAGYYDSLHNTISEETFTLIQDAYRKANLLLEFLPEDEKFNFIKDIVSSSGKSNEEVFNQLFHRYLAKLPQLDPIVRQQEQWREELSEKQKELEQLAAENQSLRSDISSLTSKVEDPKPLKTLANAFMKSVSHKMGWFSAHSEKKIIFTQLINTLNEGESSKVVISWLLKNFINVALMNRYDKKGGETHSGKACLALLNKPEYALVKAFLFSKPYEEESSYNDLLFSTDESHQTNTGQRLTSSCYQGQLYSAFGLFKNVKTIPQEKRDLAKQRLVYYPSTKP